MPNANLQLVGVSVPKLMYAKGVLDINKMYNLTTFSNL
jgi:hypothetical protein